MASNETKLRTVTTSLSSESQASVTVPYMCVASRFAHHGKTRKKGSEASTLATKFEPERLNEFLDEAKRGHTDAATILDTLTAEAAKHGGIEEWLHAATTADADIAKEFAQYVDQAFAKHTHVEYHDGSFSDGLTQIRIPQCGLAKKDGFSMPCDDDILGMVAIILAKTFQTDPAIPGIDALAIRPSSSDLAKQKLMSTAEETMAIGSAAFIKGRKRTVAARAVMVAMKTLNYDCGARWPAMYESLRTLHATVKGPFNQQDDCLR